MVDFLKRAWAQVNLDDLAFNYKTIKSATAPHSKIMAVVKADAYGHGDKFCARKLAELGADWFGVSNIEEAVRLRSCGITNPVLILGYTPPTFAKCLFENNFSQTVFGSDYAGELSRFAVEAGVEVKIHIKCDTGMSRLGFVCTDDRTAEESAVLAARVAGLPGLIPEGLYTHFASADEHERGREFTETQFARFLDFKQRLLGLGSSFSLYHCCNSAAFMLYPHMHLDMVRPGIILYGLPPSPETKDCLPLRPCMQLSSVKSQLKTLGRGTCVSYGGEYKTDRETLVATVPLGYADGYIRAMSGRADMLVNGVRAPVVGRICMDQLMLDVSGIPDVREGDGVTVFGRQGSGQILIDELSGYAGTINYETVCLVGKRVPRIYTENGVEIGMQGLT